MASAPFTTLETAAMDTFLSTHFDYSANPNPRLVDPTIISLLNSAITGLSARYPIGLCLDFLAIAYKCSVLDEDYTPLLASDIELDALFSKYPLQTRGGKANTLTIECCEEKVGIRKIEEAVLAMYHSVGRTSYPSAYVYNTGMWNKNAAITNMLLQAFRLEPDFIQNTAAAIVAHWMLELPSYQIAKSIPHENPFHTLITGYPRSHTDENGGMAFQAIAFGYMRASNPSLDFLASSVRTGSRRQRRIGDIDLYDGDSILVSVEVKDLELTEDNAEKQLTQFYEVVSEAGCLGIVICASVTDSVRGMYETDNLRILDLDSIINEILAWNVEKSKSALKSMQFYVSSIEQSPEGIARLNVFIQESITNS